MLLPFLFSNKVFIVQTPSFYVEGAEFYGDRSVTANFVHIAVRLSILMGSILRKHDCIVLKCNFVQMEANFTQHDAMKTCQMHSSHCCRWQLSRGHSIVPIQVLTASFCGKSQ